MDKLTAIKIKHSDGTYSDEIPISALAQNIVWDRTHTLVDVLGNIDIAAGTVQAQIKQLADEKIDYDQLHDYTANQISADVVDWMDENIHATDSTVIIDNSLMVSGAAADAAAAGNQIRALDLEVQTISNDLENINTTVNSTVLSLENFVNDGYVENGVAYFVHDGDVLFEITGIGGGGGGGGGGDTNNAVITVTNNTGWLSTTISSGSSCPISINWTSIEDEMPTGDGTIQILVNGAIKSTQGVQQGDVTIDLGNYVSAGSNIVKVRVSDIYGNARTINFNITVVVLSISSTFDASIVYDGAIIFPYTPVGAVAKTIYFILDGRQIGTQQTSVSGRQISYVIQAQTHGSHSLKVYFESEINNETVRSNELYYEFISVVPENDTVIIASPYNTTTQQQYTSIVIPYTVYDPTSLTAEVKIYANDNLLSTQTVDRTQQSYTYRAEDAGSLVIKLQSGSTIKTINITITELDIDVAAETEDLVLYLSSKGRSNQEANPATWSYNDISATFSDFNWASDGWQSDDDGITVLRVAGDARVTIPYKPFASDFRTTGKTIEIEFATRDVLNYDANIFSCLSGGRGMNITAQKATLYSEQSEISTQYKEDEHVRIAFVAEKRSENRLLFIYINGIASGVIQYPQDDDFSQTNPVNISIGSNDCTMDIYCIRIYDNDLTRFQVVDNWIADTQVGSLMLDRYIRNNVFDEYGNIVISKLPSDLPYMIRTAAELPQYKGDKKTISISYVDPTSPSKSFTAEGVQSDVQGTSSQYYPRKNYKDKYKNGFVINNTTVQDYAINNVAIPTDTFTMKADVASSEGANNVELARLYNEACPYKTPPQLENPKIRQGIDGFPIVMFWNDGTSTSFLGKYNFNNDKSTEEVFGFEYPDESWEIKNNTSNRVLWKSDDYAGSSWLNDFEARYPDTDPPYEDPAQLAEFASWVKSTDTTHATGNVLPAPVTYQTEVTETIQHEDSETGAISYEEVTRTVDVTFTNDTAEYRLAKFKAEAGDYMEIQSALFYYLFTQLFLMVDSRAKNAFPSFMGSEISQ